MGRFRWSLPVLSLFLAPLALTTDALAQDCGPACNLAPGHYVLCNDSVDVQTPSSFTAQAGQATFEMVCGVFQPPEANFTVRGFYTLFGPGTNPITMNVRIYADDGSLGISGAPFYEQGFSAPGNFSAFEFVEFFGFTAMHNAAFRMCMVQGNPFSPENDDRIVGNDTDGFSSAGANRMTIIGQPGGPWFDPSTQGILGDFAIRPIVLLSDTTPWQAGGVCNGGGADAGFPDSGADAGVDSGVDAGAQDTGAPTDTGGAVDTGAGDSGSPPADTGPAADTGVTTDTGVTPDSGAGPDGSVPGDDSGVVDPGQGPSIDGITPSQGLNTIPVDVIITGKNFIAEARVGNETKRIEVRIGEIPLTDVELPASPGGTILASVPPGILPEVYDLVVQNPDGQAATRFDAYTVQGEGGADTGTGGLPEAGCSCSQNSTHPAGAGLGILLLLAWVVFSSTRSERERVRVRSRRKSSR